MVMKRLSSKPSSRRGLSLPGVVAALAVLGAVVFACLAMTQPAAPGPRPAAAPAANPSAEQIKPIEQVRLGDRVLGRNPEMTDEDRAAVDLVDPATWKAVTLRLVKSDGTTLTAELLRPQAWLEDAGVVVGATIYLDMPELGAVGDAEVLAVGPCPAIAAGAGQIVTGRFAHTAGEVLDLRLDDSPDPIGVTASHPFYSADRRAFIPAGELLPGENVTTLTGTARVASVTPRGPAAEPVYNLEVHGEHVYHVGPLAALVHNACETFNRFGSEAEYADWKATGTLRPKPRHSGPKRLVKGSVVTNPKRFGPSYRHTWKLTADKGATKWLKSVTDPGTVRGHDLNEVFAVPKNRWKEFVQKFNVKMEYVRRR